MNNSSVFIAKGLPLLLLCAVSAIACSDDGNGDSPSPPSEIPIETIELSESELTLGFGERVVLDFTVTPEDADEKIVWQSSDPDCATVDGEGEIVVVGAGRTVITASAAQAEAVTCVVTVAPEIYVVGSYNENTAYVWKDGRKIDLTDGGIAAVANDVYVSAAGDVYVAGWDTSDGSGITRAVLWKNGEMSYLSDGKVDTQAKSVCVIDGDVYVAGNEVGVSNRLFLWKNGEAAVLPSAHNYAEVGGMAVSGSGDVWVAGYDNGPAVWENGNKRNDALGDDATQLLGICFHEGMPRYCGYRSDDEGMYRAMVWTGTQPTELTDGSDDCMANAVWVSAAGDLYVAGNRSSSPREAFLWKNGRAERLEGETYKAFDVAGFGDDCYVVGTYNGGTAGFPPRATPKVAMWTNGEFLAISDLPSDARAIFVRVK